MELRPYQKQLKNDIRAHFSAGRNSLILCSPTGSGKTVTFADICADTVKRGNKVIICVDRKELLDQAKSKLTEYGLRPEIITGGKKWIDYSANCYVATVQTLKRRKFPFANLVVIDEAHKQIFDDVVKEYKKRGAFIIGATATPIRKGNKATQFGSIYDEIVQSVEIADLISDGFLSPARTFGAIVEMDEVKIERGDYSTAQMFDNYDKPFLYDGVVNHWNKHARGRKTIVFNINVEHSKKTRDIFIENGISAEHVDGTTPKLERERILRNFKNGFFKVLCNVDILTTGYDEPSLECIVVNRRTKSVPLWLQMCGRGSRIFKGKQDFVILDMGGNTIELGHWEQIRKFSLWHAVKNGEGVAPTKTCPAPKRALSEDGTFKEYERHELTEQEKKKFGCESIVHASASICSECGFEFPKSTIKMIESELVEIGSDMKEIPEHLKKPYSEMNFDELKEIQELKGFKKHWILHQIEKSDENLKAFAEFMGYKKSWIHYAKKEIFKIEK